jgi:GNAT superfamily N-acetyltransferase
MVRSTRRLRLDVQYIAGRFDCAHYNRILSMKLVPADGPLLELILDHTYDIWHEGLTRHAYAQWNAAQQRTPWGRRHLQRIALVSDAGDLLSTAKRYRFDARLDDRAVRMCGIGAVFTPPEQRGRGYAAALIERLLEAEQRDGIELAALFSEIAPAFYERFGFHAVPFDEMTVTVARKDGAPAMLVRAGDERDLPAIAAMHDTRSADARFALRRDPALVRQSLTRKRALAGLGPAGLRQLEFFVAEEGASAVAYVVLSVNAYGWTLEEAGDRDPAAARLGAMLQVLVAREPSHTMPLIRTWWPRAFSCPPQLALIGRSAPRDVFMVRALAGVEAPATVDDVFYWRSDQF